jgi:hypothetical protein
MVQVLFGGAKVMDELGYGDFPDIKAMALALSQCLDLCAENSAKIMQLETKIDGMTVSAMTQTGGFLPRNRRFDLG